MTTVIHEAGHAMAAFNSKVSGWVFSQFCIEVFLPQVRVLGTGLTLFLFLPAAFVDVDTSQLEVNWISRAIVFMDN